MTNNLIKILNILKDWRIATYTMHSIDGMAGALIGIFMPIYFLTLGYSALPIFIFLAFGNIFTIGFLATFLGLGAAIFTLFIGKHSDHIDKKRLLRVGAVIMALVWLGRYLAVDEISFYVLSILAGFFGVLIMVPFSSIFYINTKNNHIENFVIFREIPIFFR